MPGFMQTTRTVAERSTIAGAIETRGIHCSLFGSECTVLGAAGGTK